MTYLVPKDTVDILVKHSYALTDRNIFLEFNKFIGEWRLETDDNNDTKFQVGKRKYTAFNRMANTNHPSADRALELNQVRMSAFLKDCKKLGSEIRIIENLTTQWRLAVGFGSSGPLETGMTLHHLYGYPYIPATSVKGIARAGSYFLDEDLSKLPLQLFNSYVEKFETKELLLKGETKKLKEQLSFRDEGKPRTPSEEELKILKDNFCKLESIRSIFGSQSSVGTVTFLDGLPKEFPKLEVDVLAPHYSDYYMKGETLGDWMQPVPSFFLTVAPNTPYVFSFLVSNNPYRYKELNYSKEIVAIMTEKWLTEGLKQLGIGGKTSSGYGYFENPNERIEIRPIQKTNETVSMQLKKDEAIAEITSIAGKQVMVKVTGNEEPITCSGFRPEGIGLKVGSKIIVSLNYQDKSKKIISCSYVDKY